MKLMSNAIRLCLPAVCLLAAACSGGASAPTASADAAPVSHAPPPRQPSAEERFGTTLEQLGSTNTYRGSTVTFSTAKPAKGQWALTDEDNARLDKVAELLKQNPQTALIVEGYTDNQGDRAANLRLSQKHAELFQHALADRGIEAQRVRTHGAGEENPAADNGDAAGRAKNQRVEVIFSAMNGQFAYASDNDTAQGGSKAKNST